MVRTWLIKRVKSKFEIFSLYQNDAHEGEFKADREPNARAFPAP